MTCSKRKYFLNNDGHDIFPSDFLLILIVPFFRLGDAHTWLMTAIVIEQGAYRVILGICFVRSDPSVSVRK